MDPLTEYTLAGIAATIAVVMLFPVHAAAIAIAFFAAGVLWGRR